MWRTCDGQHRWAATAPMQWYVLVKYLYTFFCSSFEKWNSSGSLMLSLPHTAHRSRLFVRLCNGENKQPHRRLRPNIYVWSWHRNCCDCRQSTAFDGRRTEIAGWNLCAIRWILAWIDQRIAIEMGKCRFHWVFFCHAGREIKINILLPDWTGERCHAFGRCGHCQCSVGSVGPSRK